MCDVYMYYDLFDESTQFSRRACGFAPYWNYAENNI